MPLKHKAFLKAIELVNSCPKKAKKYLNDMRMTQQEKTILAGFLSLRDFDNEDVITALEKFSCSDVFVESQRHFCLGAAYNNLTLFSQSKTHLLKSLELNQFQSGELVRIATFQSLFTVYLNLHDFSGMEQVISSLKQIDHHSLRLQFAIQYSQFSLTVQQMNIIEAKAQMVQMEKIFTQLSEHQAISYLYDLFEMHLFDDDYSGCLLVIERLKRFKKFKNSTNVMYMLAMINFIKFDTPIYLYKKNYEQYPLLESQIQCLQRLEIGDEAGALNAWSNLQKLSGGTIKAPFEIEGPPTLFSKALNKLKLNVKPSVSVIHISSGSSKEEKLHSLLHNSLKPIAKEVIYEQIWGVPVVTKEDLVKLFKLVQRTKEKFSVEIKSVKGTYFIRQDKSA